MRGIGRIATAAVITVVVAAAVVSAPSAAAQQDRYPDVTGGVHKPAIDALGGTGMFDGTLCDDGRFCPTKPIERSTMAVWLIRALTDADPPPVEDSRFADVPASEWWAGHVELLAQLGITAGCGTAPLRYCPERPVTRAEMATFLTRAFNLERGEPAGFVDVDQGSTHAAGINAIAAARVTSGCGTAPLRYCPERPVTRAEMATFLARAYVPTIDMAGIEPVVTVDVGDRRPTVGHPTGIAVAVTDVDGIPLPGARLELVVDGELRDIAIADGDGRATFTLDRPTGPANEGGYDSIQVQVATTDVVSRPTGVFWQPDESRRITISVSPDSSHSGKVRTITAQVVDGNTPMAGRTVELHIDGTLAGRAPTDDDGTATFTLRKQVHGPFDLAKVVLVGDRSVASNEVLISWPLSTRGVHGSNDWEIVWRDEFGGTSLDASKWRAINNCPPVYLACDTDRPENVEVSDGLLRLRSLREPYAGTNKWTGSGSQFGPLTSFTEGDFLQRDFTAGRVDSTRDFTYGRYELLGKLPQGHGTFFAFWMRPRNSEYGNDAAGGEIDIAEGANIGRGGNRRGQIDAQLPGDGWGVHHVVHMGYPFTNPFTLTNLPVNPAESFHLYAVEWDTASIRFYVDDERVLTVPQSDWFSHPRDDEEPVENPYAPFDQPFFIVINNTIGNWALETWPGNQVPDTTVFPAEFVVDYIRVYECRPPAGTSVPGPGQGCETP
ncbi:MAG: family 16 glycosylhydrolase [Acidimicrobiaceae bacterium]|nr:family 16 glycosylhydrolase [Acidimicrobiaceae bacterium]MYE65480.1 family 16 glycosylhydrolase [Acidimicrobiaceae bacterium]MYG78988.1 family 16 glycosylhydrolase [Acidimicrobiaceae bacterium]